MFLRNEHSLGVKNGTRGTVEQVSERSMAVRTDAGRSVGFDLKDYRHVDHGYAATIHKTQSLTVDRTHVLATPGLDRHSSYVGLSRHRDGVALHYGRDDFKDDARLVRTLSRERAKDMASDYQRRDSVRAFAERREIGFGERIAELARTAAERARGIFDNFRPRATPEMSRRQDRDMFAGFRPRAERLERQSGRGALPRQETERDPRPLRAGGLRGAVERYARAVDAIRQTRAQGLDAMPHQRVALDRARDALDTIRPQASTDLNSAFGQGPELIREAAEGRGQAAMRAMQQEAEIRIDPFQRADRFVEGWQQLQRAHAELVRDGDHRGARATTRQMADMAKSLERDPQLESVLGTRGRELGLEVGRQMERSLSRELTQSIPFDHERHISLGLER